MTDETHEHDEAADVPDGAADGTPDVEPGAAAAPGPDPHAPEAAGTSPAASPAPSRPGGVTVPRWALVALASAGLVGAGFGVGWAVAPDDHSHFADRRDEAPLGLPGERREMPGADRGFPGPRGPRGVPFDARPH